MQVYNGKIVSSADGTSTPNLTNEERILEGVKLNVYMSLGIMCLLFFVVAVLLNKK